MMFNVKDIFIKKNQNIKEALKLLDKTAKGILLVVDDREKLVGTLTDGDIRRALLNGYSLEDKIENVSNQKPVVAKCYESKETIKELLIKKAVKQIPILDDGNNIVELLSINDFLLPEGKENYVIIMAGGLGTRLKDLTKEIPKPMLKVGDSPILQHIIGNFKTHGYNKFFISVNYKSEIIQNYFQNGTAYGVKIEYLKEDKRLGTAGGIKLAKNYLDKPFFVINGDIYTNVNVNEMMNFHKDNGFDLTIGTRKHVFQIPYGVVKTINNDVETIEEKPSFEYLINGGIYCINPSLIEFIPDNEYFEITDLINICIKNNKRIGSFEIKDYWMDIGKIEDYFKVNEDIQKLL